MRNAWPIAVLSIALGAVVGCDDAERAQQTTRTPSADASALQRGTSGCERPYHEASPWNTPIPDEPKILDSSPLDGPLSSDPTQFTYPVYEVDSSTPLAEVSTTGWFSNVVAAGRTLRNERRGVARIPIPEGALPAAGSDAQIIILDPATGDEWGASNLRKVSDGKWEAWNAYHYNTAWGGVPPSDSEGRPFFPRGAGVPYLAGLVRPCEIARKSVDHALAFAYDHPTAEFVYPATKSDGRGVSGEDLPEGSRLQLDPTLTPAEIARLGCGGPCATIARALQRYGMYVIDNSGRAKVLLEFQGTAGWGTTVSSKTVSPIPLSAFRLVEGPPPVAQSPPGPQTTAFALERGAASWALRFRVSRASVLSGSLNRVAARRPASPARRVYNIPRRRVARGPVRIRLGTFRPGRYQARLRLTATREVGRTAAVTVGFNATGPPGLRVSRA